MTNLILNTSLFNSFEGSFEMGLFAVLAVFIVAMSVLTVTTKRILRSATFLLFTLLGTAGLYFMLGYTFLASVQIMVYAGGIVVLYVFSILLTSQEGDHAEKLKRSKFWAGAIATSVGLAIVLVVSFTHHFIETTDIIPKEMDIKMIGHSLLSSDKYGYILPFEAVSILLLASAIGGILIARKR